jgi:hypothetical protein
MLIVRWMLMIRLKLIVWRMLMIGLKLIVRWKLTVGWELVIGRILIILLELIVRWMLWRMLVIWHRRHHARTPWIWMRTRHGS